MGLMFAVRSAPRPCAGISANLVHVEVQLNSIRGRRDRKVSDDGHLSVLWGLRMPANPSESEESLFALYCLKKRRDLPDPLLYDTSMTHEFTVFALDSLVKINFRKSLWNQPKLSPVLPALIGFQFRADSDENAIARLQSLFDKVVRGDVPPDLSSAWLPYFRDGIDIATPLVDLNDVLAERRVDDADWEFHKKSKAQ